MRREAHLPALAGAFITHLGVERGLSPNTCEAYQADLTRFIASLPQELLSRPAAIGEKHVFAFLVEERKRGRGVTSVRRTLSAVRTFFGFLVRERATTRNPA